MKLDLTKNFDGHNVRLAGTPENPLFVAADVCALLGLNNPSLAINGRADRDNKDGLDDDERGVANVNTPSGIQQMVVITESGLYHLIFKSRKAQAKRFRRWVTEEVLPSIRRDGHYVVTQETIEQRCEKISSALLSTFDQLIKRGTPPQAAAGCVSNMFRDAVRAPSLILSSTPTPQ